jgi:hypothetical protein
LSEEGYKITVVSWPFPGAGTASRKSPQGAFIALSSLDPAGQAIFAGPLPARHNLIEDMLVEVNASIEVKCPEWESPVSESTVDLIRLLNGRDLQDLNHILVFIYLVKSGVGS